MSKWKNLLIGEAINFNPTESISKGTIAKKIPMAKLSEWNRKIDGFEVTEYKSGPKFRNGDTLLAKITPCLENGKTAQVDLLNTNEVAFGSSEFIVLRATELTNEDFIYYLARSPIFRKRAISCMEGTSGRKRVNDKTLKDLTYKFPSLIEQKRIGGVLKSIDQKIELNNQINSELESLAKLVYDYWFVQFDFPMSASDAAALGKPELEGKPYKASGGKMVFNEVLKREIPKGWEVKTLSEIANCNQWNRNKTTEFTEINYLDTSSLTKNVISGYQNLNSKEDKIPSRAQRIITSNDILYSTVRPNQLHYGIIKNPVENMVASTGFAQIRTIDEHISNDFIYAFITQEYIAIRLQQIAENSVSAYPSISHNDIMDLKIALPINERLILNANELFKTYNEKISLNQKENQELSELRDWLLPMLMNGQVTVGEDNKTVEEKLGMVDDDKIKYR